MMFHKHPKKIEMKARTVCVRWYLWCFTLPNFISMDFYQKQLGWSSTKNTSFLVILLSFDHDNGFFIPPARSKRPPPQRCPKSRPWPGCSAPPAWNGCRPPAAGSPQTSVCRGGGDPNLLVIRVLGMFFLKAESWGFAQLTSIQFRQDKNCHIWLRSQRVAVNIEKGSKSQQIRWWRSR